MIYTVSIIAASILSCLLSFLSFGRQDSTADKESVDDEDSEAESFAITNPSLVRPGHAVKKSFSRISPNQCNLYASDVDQENQFVVPQNVKEVLSNSSANVRGSHVRSSTVGTEMSDSVISGGFDAKQLVRPASCSNGYGNGFFSITPRAAAASDTVGGRNCPARDSLGGCTPCNHLDKENPSGHVRFPLGINSTQTYETGSRVPTSSPLAEETKINLAAAIYSQSSAVVETCPTILSFQGDQGRPLDNGVFKVEEDENRTDRIGGVDVGLVATGASEGQAAASADSGDASSSPNIRRDAVCPADPSSPPSLRESRLAGNGNSTLWSSSDSDELDSSCANSYTFDASPASIGTCTNNIDVAAPRMPSAKPCISTRFSSSPGASVDSRIPARMQRRNAVPAAAVQETSELDDDMRLGPDVDPEDVTGTDNSSSSTRVNQSINKDGHWSSSTLRTAAEVVTTYLTSISSALFSAAGKGAKVAVADKAEAGSTTAAIEAGAERSSRPAGRRLPRMERPQDKKLLETQPGDLGDSMCYSSDDDLEGVHVGHQPSASRFLSECSFGSSAFEALSPAATAPTLTVRKTEAVTLSPLTSSSSLSYSGAPLTPHRRSSSPEKTSGRQPGNLNGDMPSDPPPAGIASE